MTTANHWAITPDEVRVVSDTGGEKGSKPAKLGTIDPLALTELAKVGGYGADKYSAFNYLKGYDWSLSFDAMQRHALAFWGGEDVDPESGLLHATHAAWHGLCLTSFLLRGLGSDDRFVQAADDDFLPFEWPFDHAGQEVANVIADLNLDSVLSAEEHEDDGIEEALGFLSDLLGIDINIDNSIPQGVLREVRKDGTVIDHDFDGAIAERKDEIARNQLAADLEEIAAAVREGGWVSGPNEDVYERLAQHAIELPAMFR